MNFHLENNSPIFHLFCEPDASSADADDEDAACIRSNDPRPLPLLRALLSKSTSVDHRTSNGSSYGLATEATGAPDADAALEAAAAANEDDAGDDVGQRGGGGGCMEIGIVALACSSPFCSCCADAVDTARESGGSASSSESGLYSTSTNRRPLLDDLLRLCPFVVPVLVAPVPVVVGPGPFAFVAAVPPDDDDPTANCMDDGVA